MNEEKSRKNIGGVTGLLSIFRDSLLALIPYFERSGITLKQLEEIDLFDNICESLFEILVLPKIETYMEKKHNFVPPLPKYGFHYKDYSKNSYIEVIPDNVEFTAGIYVFVLFKSNKSPFDTVVCDVIDDRGKVLKREVEIPYSEAIYRFRFKLAEGDIILS
ncbi:MAG: hypothetical protein N2517_00965 [Ignavibacteria bacterium]|nr:hypothetical protein [Ignavibacteria bacterium]